MGFWGPVLCALRVLLALLLFLAALIVVARAPRLEDVWPAAVLFGLARLVMPRDYP